MSEREQSATVDSRNDCPLRYTPRADALWKTWEKDPHGVTKYAAMFLLAKELENDLELCRDAHMANCLAADTLRAEIRALRGTPSATASSTDLVKQLNEWRDKWVEELPERALCEFDRIVP